MIINVSKEEIKMLEKLNIISQKEEDFQKWDDYIEWKAYVEKLKDLELALKEIENDQDVTHSIGNIRTGP
jgi:hypothetical protein